MSKRKVRGVVPVRRSCAGCVHSDVCAKEYASGARDGFCRYLEPDELPTERHGLARPEPRPEGERIKRAFWLFKRDPGVGCGEYGRRTFEPIAVAVRKPKGAVGHVTLFTEKGREWARQLVAREKLIDSVLDGVPVSRSGTVPLTAADIAAYPVPWSDDMARVCPEDEEGEIRARKAIECAYAWCRKNEGLCSRVVTGANAEDLDRAIATLLGDDVCARIPGLRLRCVQSVVFMLTQGVDRYMEESKARKVVQ